MKTITITANTKDHPTFESVAEFADWLEDMQPSYFTAEVDGPAGFEVQEDEIKDALDSDHAWDAERVAEALAEAVARKCVEVAVDNGALERNADGELLGPVEPTPGDLAFFRDIFEDEDGDVDQDVLKAFIRAYRDAMTDARGEE